MGDEVRLRQGLDLASGTVLDIYGNGAARRAVVAMEAQDGTDADDVTITVPLSELLPRGMDGDPAGHWVLAQRYERAIARTLARLAGDLQADFERETPSDHADFAIQQGDRIIVVEVKAGKPLNPTSALTQLRQHSARQSPQVHVLPSTWSTSRPRWAIDGACESTADRRGRGVQARLLRRPHAQAARRRALKYGPRRGTSRFKRYPARVDYGACP